MSIVKTPAHKLNVHVKTMLMNAILENCRQPPWQIQVAPSVQRCKVWLMPTTRVPCSNAAKTRNLLKFAGVPQTPEPISAISSDILVLKIILVFSFYFILQSEYLFYLVLVLKSHGKLFRHQGLF